MFVASIILVTQASNIGNQESIKSIFLKIGRQSTDNRWVRLNVLKDDDPDKDVINEIWIKDIGKFIIPMLQFKRN